MLYDYDAFREIFVVFLDNTTYLGSRLMKKGFTHCFAMERQALGWLCIDPSRKDCLSHILPATFLDPVMDTFIKNNPNATVIQLFVSRQNVDAVTYPKFGLISCVGMIQYNLGVYWPLIITPFQLYCRLVEKRISHIKVGNVWVARAQSEKPEQPQRHQGKKHKTSATKRPRYRKEQNSHQRKHNAR